MQPEVPPPFYPRVLLRCVNSVLKWSQRQYMGTPISPVPILCGLEMPYCVSYARYHMDSVPWEGFLHKNDPHDKPDFRVIVTDL